MDLIEIDIPDEFLDLCEGWAGDTDCMLRAVSSTGGLTLGTNRPYSDDVGRYMTDAEWHVHLWNRLSSDLGYVARLAERDSHEDAGSLREFEAFADDVADRLRAEYGLLNSEIV